MRIYLACPIKTLFLNLKAVLLCTYEIQFNSIFMKILECEFESIFVESIINCQTSIVGEIYHIPNTNVTSSIQRYEPIINKIQSSCKQIIIGTDQNVDYLKIDNPHLTWTWTNPMIRKNNDKSGIPLIIIMI